MNIEASNLRDKLLTLLSEDLGVYKNKQPSIWVYGSSNPPSSSDGLECLIKAYPIGVAKRASAGQKIKEQLWEITLKNFKESRKLLEALSKVEKQFVIREIAYLPSTVDIYEQARIVIYDCIGVNV